MRHSDKLRSSLFVMAATGAAISASPALGQSKDDGIPQPKIYTELVACKSIQNPTERLACFDEKVLALETATNNKDVVVADREQVKEARRGLFGLSLPRIKLFGNDDDEDAIDSIEAKILSTRKTGINKLSFRLDNDTTWVQVEPQRIRRPKQGDQIVIKRAALGSFMAKINGARGFRIRRVAN